MKRRLTFNGLRGIICQKIELFINTAVRTSNPRNFLATVVWRNSWGRASLWQRLIRYINIMLNSPPMWVHTNVYSISETGSLSPRPQNESSDPLVFYTRMFLVNDLFTSMYGRLQFDFLLGSFIIFIGSFSVLISCWYSLVLTRHYTLLRTSSDVQLSILALSNGATK
jgi:hypothetical protein